MKNYNTPQVEVIEIELEGVLCTSGTASSSPSLPKVLDDGSAW